MDAIAERAARLCYAEDALSFALRVIFNVLLPFGGIPTALAGGDHVLIAARPRPGYDRPPDDSRP